MTRRLRAALRAAGDAGASAVEYGLLIAAIAAVVVGVTFGLGGMLEGAFQETVNCLEAEQNAPGCPEAP